MKRPLFHSKPEAVISLSGLFVMFSLLVYWCLNGNTANKAGHIAAITVVVLFCTLCLSFVRRWMECWLKGCEHSCVTRHAETRILLGIFLSLLAASFLFYLIVHEIRLFLGDTTTFMEGLDFYLNLDTGNYLAISEYLYDFSAPAEPERLVFYPGYPLVVRFVALFFNNYLISAVFVSVIFYALSGCMLYKLLLLDYDFRPAICAVKYMALLPGAFFFAFPLSESLFLFSSICCIYLARTEKWFFAGLLGAFAAFTRSLGVLILAPLVFEAVAQKKNLVKNLALSLIVPFGTLAYLAINYLEAGSPFAFQSYESSHWGQEFGLFFSTTAYQVDNALADLQTDYYTSALGIWIPNVVWCLFSLCLMVFATRKLRPSYSVWFIVYYVFAVAPTFLISAPRYLIACLPIYPALSELYPYRKMEKSLSVLCLLFSFYYIFAFSNLWNVY